MLGTLYVIWAGLFVYQSSYVAIDGQRYFGLFDDAMISMRYAWNFAHGLGLVWNAGQRVEGYSNLLMTLGMSLAALALDKKLAVLAVQVAGIPTVVITAVLAWRLYKDIAEEQHYRALAGVLVGACVLFYYPLSYWTLMGMETGLLTLLTLACAWFGLRWLSTSRTYDVVAMSLSAGLAFLTRNDLLVLSAVIFAYLGIVTYQRRKGRLLSLLYAGLLLVGFVAGQTAFRYIYYGSFLPNTYTLKLTGIPLYIRLIGGFRFVLEFLRQSWLVLALAVMGALIAAQSVSVLLLSIVLAAIAYQIYAGGDPWSSWRLLAPAMPAAFILATWGASALISRWRVLSTRKFSAPVSISLLVCIAVALADAPFLADMAVRAPTSAAIANRVNTDSAIAIDALTRPEASVGVIWAGTLPYYADRYSVDFLGKSDPYIAHLNADISGAVSWGGMISVPGHNKYDLNYSIVQLVPTYIQAFAWGYATVKPFVMKNYDRVEYHGAAGTKTVFLRRDLALVCWDACKDEYQIIPWPVQR